MINGLFDKTMSLLASALDLRAERQKLLASNIANGETPGYRAVDINFEDELRRREGSSIPGATLVSTNPQHMPGIDILPGQPRIIDRASDLEGYDENSVGIEGEMVKLSENSLMYDTSEKMLKSKFSILMTAIKEGGQ